MVKLRYGNTNTFYIPGTGRGLLVDTDYAGTLALFFKSLKAADISTKDISYVLATHFHPDHIGILSELQKLGMKLLLIDVQRNSVHYADGIFSRDKRFHYDPIDEGSAEIISCAESRDFLSGLGICGEIIHTPSHSPDSISLILDSRDCIVGDLEPYEYLAAYGENPELKRDWDLVMSFQPKRILYAHANEKIL